MPAVVAVYPVLKEWRMGEPFSELGVLGPNGKIGDYPRDLVVGQEFSLLLYVGNHEGQSEYYRVEVKSVDQTLNISDTMPLDFPSFRSWETVLGNESNTTIPITMSLGETGPNRRLVFELWRYNPSSHVFVYNQRWTQLWFNVTAPIN